LSRAGRALTHAFEIGALAQKRAFFLRAEPLPLREVVAEQSFRPDYLRLQQTGWTVAARLETGSYELGLVLLTKHKEENFANIARAWELVAAGGTLACAGASDDGAASLERHVARAFGGTGSLSKFHSRVFWFIKAGKAPPDYWRKFTVLQPVGDGSWMSQPGIFSWDRVDDGSALLARHLPRDLAGRVADFGCGWGYLSRHVLAHCPAVQRLDGVDAEHRAIEAAQANVDGARASFHWLDVTAEPLPGSYDAIVCNPPFHTRRAASPSLGQQVIEAAARALKPGGRLYMVANRGLPYEATLKAHFASFVTLVDNNKFRVWCATR
jgi:16S rRNA (guanine1207-N2)-methyltransferase